MSTGTKSILCGDCDDNMIDALISKVIMNALGDQDVRFVTSILAEDILRFAENEHYDLAVIIVNNIIYQDGKGATPDNNEQSLNLISTLAHRWLIPVIVFYHLGFKESYAENALRAGALAAHPMPCPPGSFKASLDRWLANQ